MLNPIRGRCATLAALLAVLLTPMSATAAMVERPVDYEIDGRVHRGYVHYDDGVAESRPLLLMVPNWLGTSAANREQAAEIAGQRYVIFVADMYGRDTQPDDADAAGKLVRGLYGDRPLLRKRVLAAKAAALREVSTAQLPADPDSFAAIGFCFGGASVLELARTGEPLDAVVSLHGNLSLPPGKEKNQPLQTRILALHGDADPYVPPEQVQSFLDEMRAAGADWQLVRYGGAVHSFTDPHADTPGQAMYDAKTARRAFATMRDFLDEAFAAD